MIFFKKKRKGYILIQTILAMIVVTMLSYSIFTITSGQFSMIQASRVGLQAQQYAQIDANTLQLLSYDELDSSGAHARQTLTSVANATDWQDEITIGAEQTIGTDSDNKQRIAKINIYKTGDTLARYSLQVPLSSKGSNSIPVGTIVWFAASSPPRGYLECDGQSTSSYPALAKIVGATVPDLRGEFIRGWDHGRGIDTDRIFNSSQLDQIQNIVGSLNISFDRRLVSTSGAFYNSGSTSEYFYDNAWNTMGGGFVFDASRVVRAGEETRSRNIDLLPCIKY